MNRVTNTDIIITFVNMSIILLALVGGVLFGAHRLSKKREQKANLNK